MIGLSIGVGVAMFIMFELGWWLGRVFYVLADTVIEERDALDAMAAR